MRLYDVVRKAFDLRYKGTMEVVINGVPDFAEYRYQQGYLRGMYDFMADIDGYLKSPEQIEDEEMEEGR